MTEKRRNFGVFYFQININKINDLQLFLEKTLIFKGAFDISLYKKYWIFLAL